MKIVAGPIIFRKLRFSRSSPGASFIRRCDFRDRRRAHHSSDVASFEIVAGPIIHPKLRFSRSSPGPSFIESCDFEDRRRAHHSSELEFIKIVAGPIIHRTVRVSKSSPGPSTTGRCDFRDRRRAHHSSEVDSELANLEQSKFQIPEILFQKSEVQVTISFDFPPGVVDDTLRQIFGKLDDGTANLS